MKIFISWSGDLSKSVAEILKKSLPLVIQVIDPFVSSNSIDKGELWDTRITQELADADFCIVCLTKENVKAPWVNFEAGAISQKFNSKVSALLVDIKPSDIEGPLSRFQATSIVEKDFFALFESINKNLDRPLSSEILKDAFSKEWEHIDEKIKAEAEKFAKSKPKDKEKTKTNEDKALEEILTLVRRQSTLLADPERIFPIDYLCETISNNIIKNKYDNIRVGDGISNIIEDILMDLKLSKKLNQEITRFSNVESIHDEFPATKLLNLALRLLPFVNNRVKKNELEFAIKELEYRLNYTKSSEIFK